MLKRHGNGIRRGLFDSLPVLLLQRPIRHSSTLSSVVKELTTRPLGVSYDYLFPTPSYLLNISLADFLPFDEGLKYPSITSNPRVLPQGHHIVYFPPPVTHNELLPDGTDTLHSPAAPTSFTRRLWAGGSVAFNPSPQRRLRLDGARAACIEGIRDVTIKGKGEEEKIFVYIERRIGYANTADANWRPGPHIGNTKLEEGLIRRIWEGNEAAVVEKRNLVFLRNEKEGDRIIQQEKEERIIKPSHSPHITIALTPSSILLFRFSALTFNAHAIHLDRAYSRAVEGHRNLLVHGPLSLVLMLTVLRSRLADGEMVREFTYRNLAPLYAEEEMRVCLRKDGGLETTGSQGRWDVWIEGRAGGYAVKGSATVGIWEDA